MATVEILHADAVLRIGRSRNLLVLAWLGVPEAAHFRAMTKAMHASHDKHGAEGGVLDVIISGKPTFTDESRDGLVRVLRDPRFQSRGTAHVLELGGLAGVATRAFLSTAILVARPTAAHKVFGDVDASAAWLAPRISTGAYAWSPAEIVQAQAQIAPRQPTPAAAPR